MYIPATFLEERHAQLRALMLEFPLALLVTPGADGLVASPVPFLAYPDAGEHGTLRARRSRERALEDAVRRDRVPGRVPGCAGLRDAVVVREEDEPEPRRGRPARRRRRAVRRGRPVPQRARGGPGRAPPGEPRGRGRGRGRR
ncbi:MAG: FMN-binding negative transcriptional regulator [Burkholderiales bacterium]|nr:FMN-binding negative transcriptional regulator [Burkholderiales bacterium]